jgi:DinB family protein
VDLGIKYTVGADGTRVMSLPDDIRERVVSYIRETAQRSPSEIEAVVQEGQRELLDAIEGVSEAQAAYKPGDEDWSILELMAHEVSVRQVIGALAGALRNGELPPGFGPQFEEAKAQDGFIVRRFDSLAHAREAAQAAHDAIVEFVRGFDESVNTDVTFRHYYFGAFNAREWPVFLRVHDGDHASHIAKIKAAAGYPAA